MTESVTSAVVAPSLSWSIDYILAQPTADKRDAMVDEALSWQEASQYGSDVEVFAAARPHSRTFVSA